MSRSGRSCRSAWKSSNYEVECPLVWRHKGTLSSTQLLYFLDAVMLSWPGSFSIFLMEPDSTHTSIILGDGLRGRVLIREESYAPAITRLDTLHLSANQ